MGASRGIGVAGVCALAYALAWSGAAWSGNVSKPTSRSGKTVAAATGDRLSSVRGVVQSVSTGGLVLKMLDGSTVAVAVDKRTRVLIDGKPASILDVHPGFVAAVSFRGASGQAALEVDAFSTSAALPARVESAAGIVRSVSQAELVLSSLDGSTVSVSLEGKTRVFLDGKPAAVADLRPGFVAVVRPQAPTGNGQGKKPGARSVFAFAPDNRRGAHLYSGVIVTVSVHAVVLRAGAHGTFRLALPAKTVVFVDGKPASIRDVKPGGVAVVRTGPRRELWAFATA